MIAHDKRFESHCDASGAPRFRTGTPPSPLGDPVISKERCNDDGEKCTNGALASELSQYRIVVLYQAKPHGGHELGCLLRRDAATLTDGRANSLDPV